MNCHESHNELLRLDELRMGLRIGGELGRHLNGCAACRDFAAKLIRLEQAVREIPVPVGAEAARLTFLDRLHGRAAGAQPVVPARRTVARRWFRPQWAVAASLFIALGLGAWLFMLGGPEVAEAAPEIVDQLVAWNLNLTQASSPDERERLYAEHAPQLKQAVQQAVERQALRPEDRDLAETLLDSGSFLATNDDPVEEADRLSDVADKLLEKMNTAVARKNAKKVDQLGKHYSRLAEHGLYPKLETAETPIAVNPQRQEKLARIAQRDVERASALESLQQRAPAASRKEIRRAIETSENHHKAKGQHGKKK